MKVCILTTNFPRFEGDQAAANFVYTQAKAIADLGIDVGVVAPHDVNTKDFERMNGIRVYRFRYMPLKRMHKFSYRYGIINNIKNNKLIVFQIIPFYIFFILKSLKVGKNSDIIHAQWLFAGLCAIIIKLLYKKPIICTLQGSDIRLFPKNLSSYLLRRFNILVAPSLEIYHYIGKYKTTVEINNPIDTDKFKKTSKSVELIKEFNLKNEVVVTFIGRLDEIKDPITFVNAIPHVLKEYTNIKFLIVGDGLLFSKIKKKIDEYGIKDKVVMTGTRLDIPQILSISDIFVAVGPNDNLWSTTILEAMSMEVPLILTNAGRTGYYFIHEKNAYLIPVRDEKELAKGILKLIADPVLRRTIPKNNLELLSDNKFLKKNFQESIYLVYKNILGSKTV